MQRLLARAAEVLRVEYSPTSHAEKAASVLGGCLGIYAIVVVTEYFLNGTGVPLIVASMGASAVLVFGVPHGQLSQPWPVLGGHMVSAVVGVACMGLVADPQLAAALAVGLAIGVMHYLRCLHPPGGATALNAVIGGESVHVLGFQYALTPVLINVAVILTVAVVVNYFFPWRRYPAALTRRPPPEAREDQETEEGLPGLSHDDLAWAMRQLDEVIDVTEADLNRLYGLAMAHAETCHLEPEQIKLGHHYSNGRYGEKWSVRQVFDEASPVGPGSDLIIYRVAAGAGRGTTGTTTRKAFAEWARYEVFRNESSWQRVATD